jgi:hypothetical protein
MTAPMTPRPMTPRHLIVEVRPRGTRESFMITGQLWARYSDPWACRDKHHGETCRADRGRRPPRGA